MYKRINCREERRKKEKGFDDKKGEDDKNRVEVKNNLSA